MTHAVKAPLLCLFVFLTYAFATPPLPACAYENRMTHFTDYSDHYRTLLDTLYRLPETYAPPDLVTGPDGYEMRRIIIEDLNAMLAAARAAGVNIEVFSAYRSFAYQRDLFARAVTRQGREAAQSNTARPGHSEHQLGTALDLKSRGGRLPWELDDWAVTPEGSWLAEYAWEYGFIMSYPPGKRDVTCYVYEPWHYRYVGREVAQAIRERGPTFPLREWLWEQQPH